MKIRAFIPVIILIFLTGCVSRSNQSVKKIKDSIMVKKSTNTTKALGISVANGTKIKDTIFITGKSAVSFWLDSVEMERRHKKEGDDFYVGADDYAFYSAKADSFLKQKKLTIVDADCSKYLKFFQSNSGFTLIKTDTLQMLHT